MKKNNINYKVVNFAIIVVILFLFYLSKDLWSDIISIIIKIFTPFIIGFCFAYAFNPLLKYLTNKSINKIIAIFIISILLIGLITITIILIIPLLIDELSSLFSNVIIFIQNLSIKYNLNTSPLKDSLIDIFNNTMNNIGDYISIGTINIIKISISYMTIFLISFIIGIYFLFDMDKIRLKIEKYLKYKNKKTYLYFKTIDQEMSNYFIALGKIILIQLIEYTLLFYIIGHPHFLLLGILSGITVIIPYFGGMFTNIIALITASVISSKLLILTLIICIVFPNIDAYIISPKIYSKAIKLHPLIIIFAVLAGGILFKTIGIIIALPLTIIIVTTIKFYMNDINKRIDTVKHIL
jgi:predicted PurR-regulated permease PerM